MNYEEAQSYIGKTVYTVEFGNKKINTHLVEGFQETPMHPGSTYQLKDSKGNLIWMFKDTFEEAKESLVSYCESQIDNWFKDLNEVLNIEE